MPLRERTVGGDDSGLLFVAPVDDFKQQIGMPIGVVLYRYLINDLRHQKPGTIPQQNKLDSGLISMAGDSYGAI